MAVLLRIARFSYGLDFSDIYILISLPLHSSAPTWLANENIYIRVAYFLSTIDIAAQSGFSDSL